MSFWKLAYDMKWVDVVTLKDVVITEQNRFGEITPEQYKTITGVDFVA